MWRRICGVFMFVAVAAGLMTGGDAKADVVRLRMTGVVEVSDRTFVLPADVVDGAPFVAYLTYDRSVPDNEPDDPQRGVYEFDGRDVEYGLSLHVGSLVLRNDPTDDFTLIVTDDISPQTPLGENGDYFQLRKVTSIGGPPASLLPGIQIIFRNSDGVPWGSDALPAILDPSLFARAEVLASGGTDPVIGAFYSITAHVNAVTVIPEPPAVVLAITAFSLIAAMTAFRRIWPRRSTLLPMSVRGTN